MITIPACFSALTLLSKPLTSSDRKNRACVFLSNLALQHCFFTFLERFDADALSSQLSELRGLVNDLDDAARQKLSSGAASGLRVSKNIRRTLVKQQQRVEARLAALEAGTAVADPAAPRRCRQCSNPRTICNGYCWGIWRGKFWSQDSEGASCWQRLNRIKIADLPYCHANWNRCDAPHRASKW